MKPQTSLAALVTLIAACVAFPAAAAESNVGLPRYPALSPDASTLIFSWAGDLWEVPTQGGEARRLSAHPGDDLEAAYSPDGRWIAFESRRSGYQSIFIASSDFTDIRQLTFADRIAYLAGFSADSRHVFFDSNLAHLIPKDRQMYKVPVEGGPHEWLLECYGRDACESAGGERIVFTRGYGDWSRRGYRGSAAFDIWVAENGEFRRVTQRDGNDGQPRYLPDGSIVFLSDRDNIVNVWKLPAGADPTTRAEQLTYFEEDDVRDLTVSADGTMAAFVVWDKIYTLDLTQEDAAARAVPVRTPVDLGQALEEEINLSSEATELALSPDGKTYAIVARGEVFVQAVEGERPTRRVTDTVWREGDIAWSADGRTLYFTSDMAGSSSIYAATVSLDEIDVRGEDEEPQAQAPVEPEQEPGAEPFADPGGPEPQPEPGVEPSAGSEPVVEDEPEVAAEEQPVEESEEAEEEAEVVLPRRKRWDRALRFDIAAVLETDFEDARPTPSPDGTKLAFRRGLGDLVILDLETKEETTLLDYWNLDSFEWSADSKLMVFVREDMDYNSDVWIIPADGSREAVNISQSPDNDVQAHLSADNKVLIFTSDRDAKDNFDVYMVYLDKSLEALPEYELKEYFEEAAKAAKKREPLDPDAKEKAGQAEEDEDGAEESAADEEGAEVDEQAAEEDADEEEAAETETHPFDELDLADAYLRLRQLTSLPGSEMDLALTPGGERVLFSATVDGAGGLFSVKWDGSDRQRVEGGRVSDVNVSLTGEKVTFLRGGSPRSAKPTGGAEEIPFRARIVVDKQQEQKQKFLEAARALGTIFYHPTMKGRDWPALTQKYLQLALQARTVSGFNDVVNMFIGELDASHLGIYGPNPEEQWRRPVGYLGARYEPSAEGYRLAQIYSGGPLDQGEDGPQVGDTIVEINDVAVPGEMVIDEALLGMVGQQVLVTLRRAGAAVEETKFVLATPTSYWGEDALAYAEEVKRRQKLVEEMSGGRLGYVHIEGMNEPSLKKFERDLYAVAHGKEGLVIDVRSNGGGWTTDILLTSLMVQPHAYTLPRIEDRSLTGHYPQDRRLIYAYSNPISVLCNQESFSNAEIFSHAIKTLGRGTLVGVPTYGGVISTGGTRLIDGALFRLPLRGWYLPDGTDMELNGAVPDIIVPMDPGDEVEGNDPQLKAAVDDLLKRL